jgi:signal transduction protein with GAF and PtsI domain
MTRFDNTLRSILLFGSDREEALDKVLRSILNRFRSETITLHLLDPARDLLILRAARGLPDELVALTREIPVGKGIAGETARTGLPVTSCNIKKEEGGVVQPGAKRAGVGGALCVPLFRRAGPGGEDRVVGTLGIGTVREHEYSADETRSLIAAGRVLAEACDVPIGSSARA